MWTTKTTRKEAHAEGIKYLAEAAAAIDDAESLFRRAHTAGSVETGGGPYYVTIQRGSAVVESLLKAARETVCDDCGSLIADCQCAWSQEVA